MRELTQHTSPAAELSLHERVVAIKKQMRARDAEVLASGQLTAPEINRRNSYFSGRRLTLDLASGGRLR